MPRDSGGTYTRPAGQPVVSGSVIDAAVFNTLTADVAAEMTDSLDRSGKGPMLAPLALPNGTEVLPALTFASATTTGIYTDGDLVITQGGDLARFSQSGTTLQGPLTVLPLSYTPTALSYASNWSASTPAAAWFKDAAAAVLYLEGVAVSAAGAGNTIATLPAGSRPIKNCTFVCTVTNLSFDTSATAYAIPITVTTAGLVILGRTIIAVAGGASVLHSAPIALGHYVLDGISFRVA